MTAPIGLEFLPNVGGEAEGLSDAGIETFRDRPFAAVARETGQNSRDAIDDHSRPVRMAFDIVSIPSSEFCSVDEYRTAARLCLEKARASGNEKEIGFFTQAVAALSSPRIQILRISDHNTRGVRGPCVEGQPFHTLAKADGVSTKEDRNSGGSFGIGKNAAFALSDIQTAFFSTLYRDEGGTNRFLCMGKSLFISHTDGSGTQRRRKGYWGLRQEYMPIEDPSDAPEWARRTEQ
ncbi:MAG TPA: hypothetical protein PKH07_18665, partial [bacterium]|nr:hypothetical protein [bacterium]